MKRHQQGIRVQNWHRPLAADQLGTRFRRLRDRLEPVELDTSDPYHSSTRDNYVEWLEQEGRWRANEVDDEATANWKLRLLLDELSTRLAPNAFARRLAVWQPPAGVREPLEALERRLADHERWLRQHLEQGAVVARGLLAAVPTGADLLAIEQHTHDRPSRDLLLALCLFAPFWRRRPAEWQAAGDGAAPDLVAFVLGDFPIPHTLRSEWHQRSERRSPFRWLRWLQWSVLFAQGGSLATHARLLGGSLPKRFQHHLANTPTTLEAADAMALAEVLALGGSDWELQLLRRSSVFRYQGTALAADELGLFTEPGFVAFRTATIRWLAQHRTGLANLTVEDAERILLWARHEQTEAERLGQAFSWRGRNLAHALRQSAAYQRLGFGGYRRETLHWPARGYGAELLIEADTWQFVELTSTADLIEESASLHHCVHSYDGRCVSGESAIVSVRIGGVRTLTIEMAPKHDAPVQIRGKHNRPPTAAEQRAVQLWHHLHRTKGKGESPTAGS